ncbi:M2 family metallopeptidase [Brevibacillus humidisoli]|uniref:M2 family metallopeptidase n=1 Tax=Brevibacillus humidisoli TaxID=2895522 RepID=UPI001E3FB136|nr:M2 family metallopeptidase [Brevibacillus humidisoli]UFJ43260.1 M2 family metallopeptidase [Brevibacillus humidisoli]
MGVRGAGMVCQSEQLRLSKLYRRMITSLWELLTTGQAEWAEQYEADELAYQEYLASDALRQRVCGTAQHRQSGLSELEQRVLQCLWLEMMEQQGPSQLRRQIAACWSQLVYTISTCRATIGDRSLTEQQVLSVLAGERDQAQRKEVWKAWMRMGEEVAPELLTLVQLRNEMAQHAGYDNYHDVKLATQELDWRQLSQMIRTLRDELDPLYRQVKAEVDAEVAQQFQIAVSQIKPWHYQHPFFQQQAMDVVLPELSVGDSFEERLTDLFAGYGLAIGPLLKRSDVYSRPDKSPASFSLHLDRAGDVRLSCHLEQGGDGLPLLLHELGHAAYEIGIDSDLPYALRQPGHTFLSEAVALLFERLACDREWLRRLGCKRLPDQERLDKWSRRNRLIKLYWTMTVVLFERELYTNPGQQLNQCWWDLVEEVQGVRRPDEWDLPHWAAKAHLSTLPVYYQNYLLGEIAAAQLLSAFQQVGEGWPSREAFHRLQATLFSPGASKRWDQLLPLFCGEPVTVAPLIAQVADGHNLSARDRLA